MNRITRLSRLQALMLVSAAAFSDFLAHITVIAPVFIPGEVILSFLNVELQGSTVS
jgi:hypothetical protein